MRIYASDNTDLDLISQFCGKDIWVLCHINKSVTDHWVRFISLHGQGPYGVVSCNYIPEISLRNLNNPTYKNIERPPVGVSTYSCDRIHIIQPVITKTTEELLDIPGYTIDGSAFAKFAGKNLWVRAISHSYGEAYYIMIESLDGNVLRYSRVEGNVIYPDEFYDSFGPPSESIMESYCVSFVDQWELVTPLDILIDDEMTDMINQCDQVWEEAHMYDDYEDDDDAYDE